MQAKQEKVKPKINPACFSVYIVGGSALFISAEFIAKTISLYIHFNTGLLTSIIRYIAVFLICFTLVTATFVKLFPIIPRFLALCYKLFQWPLVQIAKLPDLASGLYKRILLSIKDYCKSIIRRITLALLRSVDINPYLLFTRIEVAEMILNTSTLDHGFPLYGMEMDDFSFRVLTRLDEVTKKLGGCGLPEYEIAGILGAPP